MNVGVAVRASYERLSVEGVSKFDTTEKKYYEVRTDWLTGVPGRECPVQRQSEEKGGAMC